MSRPQKLQNSNVDTNIALFDDPRTLFLQDLKRTQFYIQSFSQSTQQLLKIAVKDDYSNPNMVRVLHQVMNLVYEITKWIYTLMQREDTPNEHCMKLLDKVAKQASQVVEAFKQAVVGEEKSLNSVFLSKFMVMTELIHKILDDFLIYGNPIFLNVMKHSDSTVNEPLQRKASERRGSVGSPSSIKFPVPITPQFDKRRASVDSPKLTTQSPSRLKSPLAREYQLPKALEDELKRSSSDIEIIEQTISKNEIYQQSPLHNQIAQQYYDLPDQSPTGSNLSQSSSRRSSNQESPNQSPKQSPKLSRKPAHLLIPEESAQFNDFIALGLPIIQNAKDRKSLSAGPISDSSLQNRKLSMNDPYASETTLRYSDFQQQQNSPTNFTDLGYVSPVMQGKLKINEAEESFIANMEAAQKTVDNLKKREQDPRMSTIYPEIAFRPAQSVHIQNFDLSVFGKEQQNAQQHQQTLQHSGPLRESQRKLNKSRDGGLNNLKWKSENLLEEDEEEEEFEDKHNSTKSSMQKVGSESSLFSMQTFVFEKHLFKESRLSLRSKCDQCHLKISPFNKRLGCKKCGMLLHSTCFKNFDGRQCDQ